MSESRVILLESPEGCTAINLDTMAEYNYPSFRPITNTLGATVAICSAGVWVWDNMLFGYSPLGEYLEFDRTFNVYYAPWVPIGSEYVFLQVGNVDVGEPEWWMNRMYTLGDGSVVVPGPFDLFYNAFTAVRLYPPEMNKPPNIYAPESYNTVMTPVRGAGDDLAFTGAGLFI